MGSVVTFSELSYRDAAAGVTRAPITAGDTKAMSAEIIRVAAGATLTETVPAGSDRYLFTLTGRATVSGPGGSHAMAEEAFATVAEGTRFTLASAGGDATIVSVLAPPSGSGDARAGFTGDIKVAARATTPVHDIPAEKKGRIYFVGKEAVRSERAHAMIVLYVKDTVTGMHMHPNAESMFVLLSGKTRFTVNGSDVVVERGQATYFPMGDRHGLRVAESAEDGAAGAGVSFLEFHVPAAYTTVRG
jgi:mannose-6-phosphate isomerase-like protein (cupin superfamily)